MQSESRLERKVLHSDDQVIKDYQDTSKNDTLYNTITIGLAALTGYGLLKTGALKPIVKPLLELADTVAKEGSDRAAVTMKTVKQWAHLRQISPSQRDMSKIQSHIPPKASIFRNRDTSLGYDVFDDIMHLSNNRQTNFHNVRELMSGTVQDIQLLARMIHENQGNVAKQRNNFLNTDIYHYMREFSNMRRDLLHGGTYAEAIMFSSEISSSGISEASAYDVATFICSLMQVARQSSAPRKIPAKARTLFI